MSVFLDTAVRESTLRRVIRRTWGATAAAWGAAVGVAPHVLHHVGPLAGAALLAGTAGTLAFGAIGFLATVPLLLRLRRRFRTWRAPAAALVLFAVMFSVSSFVIGPMISGGDDPLPSGGDELHVQHH